MASAAPASNVPSKDAQPSTATLNTAAAEEPWLDDNRDQRDAVRGFLGTIDPLVVLDHTGRAVWDLRDYDFLDEERPDTVHPSLWRMAKMNRLHGLFEVAPRIYQVRGFDISNLTVILGDTGFIVIDPLTCVETAAAAMQLVREHLGDLPVTGMIFTHSHIDHFGGAGAVVDPELATRIPIVAPAGFMHHAVVEHVNSGVAVSRRSQFMFGKRLRPGPRGQVTAGLGITLPSGRISLVEPTVTVSRTGEDREIDGVRFVFQFTPGAEAPTEINFHMPQLRALCMAETISHHMHNLYTIRGAQVRDAVAWSEYLEEARVMFADESDVMLISHHWPVWGSTRLDERIREQRDLYRYIHDQTLRLANHGLTPSEISESLTLPDALSGPGSRGNYGSLSHNTKAVYQRYLGWYDANPARLHPLPPAASAPRYIEAMGGLRAALDRSAAAFDAGEYRWAAELLSHAIAAYPEDTEAALRQADVFEQLGYQSESGPWRNFYLLAAAELRGVTPPVGTFRGSNAVMASGMSLAMLLDFAAIRLNGPAAEHVSLALDITDEDRGETRRVELDRGVLHHRDSTETPATHLMLGEITVAEALAAGSLRMDGDHSPALRLFELLDHFTGDFSLVHPHRAP